MPKYKFRLLRQMNVAGKQRDVGELVNEAAQWPNLRSYLSLEWIEKLPAADDDPDAVEYPPVPTNKLAEVLEPERQPTPVVVAGKRKTGASVAIRCRNCRKRNWLPQDFLETATWMCHFCGQAQTTVEAKEYPAPTSIGEWVESFDATAVDDDGGLRWTPGAGEAAASAAGVNDALR